MEVYKAEDIVILINKKIDDIFILIKCLPDEEKLTLWNSWQDLTNRFQATIIKIKRDIKSTPYYPPKEIEKHPEEVSESTNNDSEILILRNDDDEQLNDQDTEQSNSTSFNSVQIENIVHTSSTVCPVTDKIVSNLTSTSEFSDLNVVTSTETSHTSEVSSGVTNDESGKTLPDSDVLANDLRQLADLAAEVPYNLPNSNQKNQKSLEATLLDKENCQESAESRIDDKDDDHNDDDDGDAEAMYESDHHQQNQVSEPPSIETLPRKYPKRQRKSKKDSIYSYIDTIEDADAPTTNKENCKRSETVDSEKSEPKKRGRKKKEKLASAKEDIIENFDGSVTCKICGLRLAKATSFIAHQRQHTGSRPFHCSLCPQSFTTKANMIRHENSHKGIKPFKCEICSKCFGEKKTLKLHLLTHSGEKPFKCPMCSESFAQKGTLQYHIYRHTGHKGFLCSDCGKSFRQKSQLRCHRLRQHEKTPAFSCDMCTRVFYSKNDLSRHKLKHTNHRPYVCDVCSKAYTRPDYLKQHQNIHKGIKPYYCHDCNIQFHQGSQFYRHVKKVHPKTQEEDQNQTLMGEDFEIPVMANLTQEQVAAVLENSPGYGEVFHIAYLEQPGTIIDDRSGSDGTMVTSVTNNVVSVPNMTNSTMSTNVTNLSVSDGIIVTSNMNNNAIVTVDDNLSVSDNMVVSDGVRISDQQVTSDNVETVIIHPTIETEVDFSAINLLANATTQLSQ